MIFQLGWNVCMSTFSNTIFLLFFEWSWPKRRRPFFFATHISCSRRFLIGSEQRLVQLMLILHLYVAKINYQIKVGWRKIIIKSLLHSYTATKEQFCVVYPMHLGLLSFFIRFYICTHLNFGWYRWEHIGQSVSYLKCRKKIVKTEIIEKIQVADDSHVEYFCIAHKSLLSFCYLPDTCNYLNNRTVFPS